MGFRNKRRGRGGFGGGGHHHHHHGHGYGTGEPNGLQPGDDVGNRKSFKPVIVPPEDIGNRKDPEEAEWVPVDDVGNRIDAAPTHELSGVLLELDGKRRRRRPKGVAAPERVGRYFIGGVNPLIATSTPRPFAGKSLEESLQGVSGSGPPAYNDGEGAAPDGDDREMRGDRDRDGRGSRDDGRGDARDGRGDARDGREVPGEDDRDGRRGRRRRGRGGRDQVDGMAAQEVSERRAQRFFDFEEDDRFDYTLKSDPEKKRKDAEDAVSNVVVEAGRDATVAARLIIDGNRPKILVTIEERGPAQALPTERRAANANEPLFVMGNAALMSLNYLVNKIVNRYPDDRIRLAILPAGDERLYLDALAEHQQLRRRPEQFASGTKPLPPAVPQASPPHDTVVATPVPVGPGSPPEAFDPPTEKPVPAKSAQKPPELVKAEKEIALKVHEAERQETAKSGQADPLGEALASALDDVLTGEGAPAEASSDDEEDDEDADEAPRGKTTKKKAAAKKGKATATKKAAKSTKSDDDAPAKKAKGRPKKSTPTVEKATLKR